VIRVLSIDDHPALQAGLQTVLRVEPGFVAVGSAADEFELWPMLERTRPDVVLVDYHLPRSDGLLITRRIKQSLPAPHVILYSAYADTALALAATVAGADGLVHKGAPANELFDVIRRVARGECTLPEISLEARAEAARALRPEERPILAMAVDGTPDHEIRKALRLERREFDALVRSMLGRLRVEVPGEGPAAPMAAAGG
jgi:DNA-binding NarL/FixJ family response regulator